MIYIETTDDEVGITIDFPENVRTVTEIVLGNRILNYLETHCYCASRKQNRTSRIDVDYRGINIKSGTIGDDERPGDISLLNLIVGYFSQWKDVCQDELQESQELCNREVLIELTEIGFVVFKGPEYKVIVD